MHIPTNRRIAMAVLGIAMAAASGMASAQINPDLDPVYGTITAGANGAISFNLAKYRGEQGFSASVVQRVGRRV
jgi:hypothetical protein